MFCNQSCKESSIYSCLMVFTCRNQVLLLGEYAEVVDAIHSRPPGSDIGVQRQSRLMMPASTLEETTNRSEEGPVLVLPLIRERGVCTKPPPLQLQLHHQSLIKRKAAEFRARSEVLTANPLKAGGANPLITDSTASGSTEHVYDSVDSVTTPTTTPEAAVVFGAQLGGSSKHPPIYHVLEGPTPVPHTSEPSPVNPQTSAPPKPPRSRQRIQSCAELDARSPETNEHPQLKSVQRQLSSVVAIYEGMPERERSASSLLLSPHVTRGAGRDSEMPQKDFKEHVYRALHESSHAKNTLQLAGKEQQHKEKTVKTNSENGSQVCFQKKAEASTVYKTKEHDFQSELPKIPQWMSSEIPKENRRPQHLAKKARAGGDSNRAEEGQYYAQPFANKRQSSAELFDDPAYCTQSCGGSQKLASSTDSAIETPHFDDPSYATPSPKSKQDITQSADSLFDDPKYNRSGATADSRSLGVRFDDPKYNPIQLRNVLTRRLMEGEQGVRHSSSADHFGASSGAEFSDDLEGKLRGGNSLTNLAEQRSGRGRGFKATNV
jgi:hypothetical protein